MNLLPRLTIPVFPGPNKGVNFFPDSCIVSHSAFRVKLASISNSVIVLSV